MRVSAVADSATSIRAARCSIPFMSSAFVVWTLLAQDLLAHLLALRRELLQPPLDAMVHRVRREVAACVALARGYARQQRDRVVDRRNGVHVEQAGAHRFDDV